MAHKTNRSAFIEMSVETWEKVTADSNRQPLERQMLHAEQFQACAEARDIVQPYK